MTTPFEQWYDGIVGFHINSERLLYALYPQENGYPDPEVVRRWMVVCWNQALDAAMEYNAVDLENLKEKP